VSSPDFERFKATHDASNDLFKRRSDGGWGVRGQANRPAVKVKRDGVNLPV
jgi:hypothetical protein